MKSFNSVGRYLIDYAVIYTVTYTITCARYNVTCAVKNAPFGAQLFLFEVDNLEIWLCKRFHSIFLLQNASALFLF